LSAETYVLYEASIRRLVLETLDGENYDATHLLDNGRANYILFENFIADRLELRPNSQGGASDLVNDLGEGYEVKSFRDIEAFPREKDDFFHTAASSTFSANNKGPIVKGLLDAGDYEAALSLCRETGYDKNACYVYVNSAQFSIEVPLRFIIIPTTDVLRLLSKEDPRKISRREVLGLANRVESV